MNANKTLHLACPVEDENSADSLPSRHPSSLMTSIIFSHVPQDLVNSWSSNDQAARCLLMGIWEEIKFLYSTGWPRTALRQATSDCEVAKCPIPVLGSSRRWWWESVKLGVFRGAGVFLGQILLNNFSKGIFHPHCIMWNRRPSGQNRLLSGAPLGFCNCWLHMSLIGS